MATSKSEGHLLGSVYYKIETNFLTSYRGMYRTGTIHFFVFKLCSMAHIEKFVREVRIRNKRITDLGFCCSRGVLLILHNKGGNIMDKIFTLPSHYWPWLSPPACGQF
jgi:hypothetical protein